MKINPQRDFPQPNHGKLMTRSSFRIILLLALLSATALAADAPFHRGVNLTGWFQVDHASQIQFTRYTRTDFEQIKSLGCDVIRLPINLHFMTGGAPDYTIDPLFYSFLDQAVSWAEDLDMYLVLDNHTFDVNTSTDPAVGTVLKKVWSQMATHYKDRTEYICYEILNEPHGIDDNTWNSIQQEVIDAIRAVDEFHYIVAGPANWNSYHNLDEMPVLTGGKIIYTFHFYDPFLFTHQGASWVSPSMEPLAGVPFPYQADSMPSLPSSLEGSWIEDAFNGYPAEGSVASVKSLIDMAVQFGNSRNVPLFCGEFGVLMSNSRNSHRIAWYQAVREYLEEKAIAWTTWDYHGGFGLFNRNSNGLFEHDLNVGLVGNLGLEIPLQTPYALKPDSTGFMVYTDYTGPHTTSGYYGDGILNFYSTVSPNNGNYCLAWSEAARYNAIDFDFVPDRDLSRLAAEHYSLDMIVRGSGVTSFDIRFLDTKTTSPSDHPWRMRYTVNSGTSAFDRRWHHVRIPLTQFTEQGAWDGSWYNPEGKFDWKAIDRFQIVAEESSLAGELWLDNIHISDMDTARVLDAGVLSDITDRETSARMYVFPNPAHGSFRLRSTGNEPVNISLTDCTGRVCMVRTCMEGENIDVSSFSPGIYLVQIVHDNGTTVNRITLY